MFKYIRNKLFGTNWVMFAPYNNLPYYATSKVNTLDGVDYAYYHYSFYKVSDHRHSYLFPKE